MAENTAAPTTTPPAAPAAVVPPVPKLPHGVRLYEAMWLVDANTGREDFTKIMAALKEVIEKGGGTWINGDKWEERRLAYPIKKKKRGLYILTHFSAPTDAVTKIDRNAKLAEIILRHMILVDEDGLVLTPQVRSLDDEDFGGGFGGGGGERRFFGGGGGGPRGDRR